MGPSCPLKNGAGPPIFGLCLLWPYGRPSHLYCWALMSSLYHETMSCSYSWLVSDIAIFVLKRDVKLQLTNSYSWQLAKRGCQLPVSFIDFLQLLTYYLLTVYWSATQCPWMAVLPTSCWVGPILCRSLWPHFVWIGRYTQRHCQSQFMCTLYSQREIVIAILA